MPARLVLDTTCIYAFALNFTVSQPWEHIFSAHLRCICTLLRTHQDRLLHLRIAASFVNANTLDLKDICAYIDLWSSPPCYHSGSGFARLVNNIWASGLGNLLAKLSGLMLREKVVRIRGYSTFLLCL